MNMRRPLPAPTWRYSGRPLGWGPRRLEELLRRGARPSRLRPALLIIDGGKSP